MSIRAANIHVGYRQGHPVFSSITFNAAGGDMIALLGVNGIGKSTLLRTLSGLQNPLEGDIIIGGQKLTETSAAHKARLVSVVLTEKLVIDNMSVRSLVTLGRSPYTGWLGHINEGDEKIVAEVIALLKLEKLQHKNLNELSDGERQKVLIARALCQQTPVIILDEPTAFLDFRNKRDILATLQSICSSMGKTVILSTHDIETALEYCNKCWVMMEDKRFVEVNSSPNFATRVKELLNA